MNETPQVPMPSGPCGSGLSVLPRDIATTTQSAWYKELKKRPALLGTRDIQEILGVGRTHAWQIMKELGAIRVGTRLKVDRNAVIARIVADRRIP